MARRKRTVARKFPPAHPRGTGTRAAGSGQAPALPTGSAEGTAPIDADRPAETETGAAQLPAGSGATAQDAPATEDLAIREFRADDVDGLFFLEQRCYEAPSAMDYPQLRALLKDPAIATLVIVGQAGDAPRMVGALIVRREPEQARLTMISLLVDPDYRRLGLGRRLAEWAQRASAAAGLASVAAPVEAENAAGAAFLLAQGFTPAPDGGPFFTAPEDGSLWHFAVPPAETP